MRVLAFATLALAAAGCNLRTCTELEQFEITNYHYSYSGICAFPHCRSPVSYNVAEGMCKMMGARLCTMSEITHDVAKGVGCSMDHTNVWTSTSCPGGHVTMAGSFVGSREEGMGPQCRNDIEETFSFVCCSSDDEAKACVTETAEECESDCCKDLEVTYNPVPCKDDFDCQSCIPLQEGDRCLPEGGENIHMKKLMTPEGEMCCNMEPGQAKCHNGFCSAAPCMGEGLFDPQWPAARGDEWSRAMCKACHHNGCDQCMDGYFKNDYNSECVDCKVLKGCSSCHDFGCNQCKNNRQPKKCDNLRGARRNTCCDSGEKTMCVKSTSTLSPLPPHTPEVTPKPDMMKPEPTPEPTVATPTPPAKPEGCSESIARWGNCNKKFNCCAEGLTCVVFNPWYAQCQKATTSAPVTTPMPTAATDAPTVVGCPAGEVFGCGKCWGSKEEAFACTCTPEEGEYFGCGKCWGNQEDAWACSCTPEEGGEYVGCDYCFPSEEEASTCTCKPGKYSGCGTCWDTLAEATEC